MIKYLKKIIKKILYFPLGLSIADENLNLYKTFFVNIKVIGLKGIYCWPIYIYTKTKIYNIGEIKFDTPLKNGILRIGEKSLDAQGITKLINRGKIIILGPVEIFGGTIINNLGTIHFEGYNAIGFDSSIIIIKSLRIGCQTRIGFKTSIMDSDLHFTINTKTLAAKNFKKEIIIGKYNWIGNTSVIKKGTITPDYLIVASSNTQLIKDYSDLPQFSVVGGIPAKLISSGIRRIYNFDIESDLVKYFDNKPEEEFYQFDINPEDLDYFCSNKF